MIKANESKDENSRWYVESSNILMIEYNKITLIMEVYFKNGGVYEYQNVDMDTVLSFVNSDSQGRYLNTVIKKGDFPSKKLYTLKDFEIEQIIEDGNKDGDDEEISENSWGKELELTEYQTKAIRTRAPLVDQYKYMDTLHMLLGLTTEIGELSDPFKKHLAYGKEIDWVNVKEELADIMWYVVNFCDLHNINLKEEMGINIKKLEARFPEKFYTSNGAINRDLDTERKILEGGK